MVNGYRKNGMGFGEALLDYLSAGTTVTTTRRQRTTDRKTVVVTQLLPNPNVIGPRMSPV